MAKVITIDGPGGSGKSTVARGVAERLGWALLDSGAVYRALTCWGRQTGCWDPGTLVALLEDGELEMGWGKVTLHGKDLSKAIREPSVTAEVWRVADLPEVRKAVNAFLRDLAEKRPTVAEGRDMGTEAFPKARLKVYLDASPEARAHRRGLQGEGETPEALADRVRRERERKVGGLKAAPDALHIDATHIPATEVIERIVQAARERGLHEA